VQIFSFTPQETKALIFLVAALLVGSGITWYKRTHPQFAPELKLETREAGLPSQVEPPSTLQEETGKINLNQASEAELERLPGVGPTLSRRIVEYRIINGPFHQVEEIMQVAGIGPKTFERIKHQITVK
jgi:comEA protein